MSVDGAPTNPFYNYEVDIQPLTRVTSAFIDQQLQAIEEGFDLLAGYDPDSFGSGAAGEDTGTVNAYEITNQFTSTLTDGEVVIVDPANTNTGPSTLVVNSSTAVNIVRNDGNPVQAGDIIDGVPFMVIYDETNTRWVHVGATALQARGRPGVKEITADYTLTAGDEGYIIRVNSTSAITVTIPSGLAVGYLCHLHRVGTGEVTAAAGSGVVLRTAIGPSARSQYSSISVAATASDDFMLLGDAKA